MFVQALSPMPDFNTHTETEIRSAIAPNAVLLTGHAPVKRYHAEAADGLRPIHIITLATDFRLTDNAKSRLLALRDQLVAQRELLLVIAESEDAKYENDLTGVISEEIAIENPYFLALRCYRDHDCQTTIDGTDFEPLRRVIQDIRWGGIVFNGPVTGSQSVNIELMKDTCWKCRQPMRTVTGLVFPDRQLSSWDNEDWLYYNQLVALGSLPDEYALSVQAFAKQQSKRDPLVTPVEYRYSHTTQSSYWAAVCPHCDALRGDFHVQEARMNFLFDLSSRVRKDLDYYLITFDVNQNLLQILGEGFDGCPHTRIMGWAREF